MPGLATPLLWVLGAGLVAGAAIKRSTEAAEENESADREKRHAAGFGQFGGFREDYVENVAPNCREYPAFGVANPMDCALMKQGDNLMYNSLMGNVWHQGCDLNWDHKNEHCYFVGETNGPGLTWDEAKTICSSAGSTLASIKSQTENEYIESLLIKKGIHTHVYIGGKKWPDGQWRWIVDQSLVKDGFGGDAPWDPPSAPSDKAMAVKLTTSSAKAVFDTLSEDARIKRYLCKKHVSSKPNIPGLCRWDAHRANSDTKSACMCPTNMETCNKRPNCYWYEDPRSPFKECISNMERFYNMLHRLLMRRGKKDFAIKIRYGATPARGQLPYGLYGPAIIGQGNPNPNSMYGVYGMRNPYDKQQGMGMFQQGGVYGPQTQLDAYGRPLPHPHMYGQYNYQTSGSMGAGHYGNRQNLFNQHQHMHHGHQQHGHHQHGYQQHQHGFQQQQQQLTPQQQRYQQQEQYQQQQRQEQQQQQQQQQPQQHFGQFQSSFHRN